MELASSIGVDVRSKMLKDDLIAAIRSARATR
jgi:hypothetical protein